MTKINSYTLVKKRKQINRIFRYFALVRIQQMTLYLNERLATLLIFQIFAEEVNIIAINIHRISEN